MKNKIENPRVLLISFFDKAALGPRMLLTSLQNAGYKNSFLVFFGEKEDYNEKEIKNNFKSFFSLVEFINPDIIGISLLCPRFLKVAIDIINLVKKKNKERFIIIGGQNIILSPEKYIPHADAVCTGEGQEAILKFIKLFSEKKDYYKINNFWFKKKNDIIKNELSPRQDINDAPSIRYFNKKEFYIDDGKIKSYLSYKNMNAVYIMCSSGCPFECSYCLCPIIDKKLNKKRFCVHNKSVSKIIGELKYLKKLGFKYFTFVDRIFPWQPDYVGEFSKRYKKEIGLPFNLYAHPKLVKKEVMKNLASAGLSQVMLGVQTGSEKIRKEIYNRNDSNETIINSSKILNDLNIPICYDFIVDNPYETKKDYKKTFNFLLKLKSPFIMNIYSLILIPGTPLTERILKDDSIKKERLFSQNHISLNKPEDLDKINIKENEQFYILLYLLTQIKSIPKSFIWLLSKNKKIGSLIALKLLKIYKPRIRVSLLRKKNEK